MSTLDQERDLLVMADALGLGGRPAPVRAIVDYCRKRIAGWLPRGGALGSIEQLELLVCEKLYIVIEEIWSDADLEALIRRYVAMGEIAFANLVNEFDDGTFGTVYERKLANARSHDRYVAFIDCRGPQKSGAAVLYPLARNCPRAYKLQTTRTAAASSRVKSSPTEKMMDLIAGEIGFFDPLFRPLLEAELRRTCRLTFAGIERLRQQFCDSASFQSTVNACLSRVPFAGACVEAGLDCKKSEEDGSSQHRSGRLPRTPAVKKLRLLTVAPNEAARAMGLHRKLRVPQSSVISEVFSTPSELLKSSDLVAEENLGDWEHSDGSSLRPMPVRVEARKLKDTVLALIQSAVC